MCQLIQEAVCAAGYKTEGVELTVCVPFLSDDELHRDKKDTKKKENGQNKDITRI